MFASMSPRRLMLLGAAMGLSLITALLVRSWVDNVRQQSAAPVVSAEPAKPVKVVLVAAKALPAGHFLHQEDFAWVSWPDDNIGPAYLLQGVVNTDALLGSVVRTGVAAGDPITDAHLVKRGEHGFLAAILAPGMRAITVPITANTGLSGLVIPGDRIDVILTMSTPGAKDGPEKKLAETVLQDIRVLAVDQRLDDQSSDAIMAHATTLEVTPKQAEILSLLGDVGKLSMTLRSVGSAESDAEPHEPTITWENEATQLPIYNQSKTAATKTYDASRVDVVRGTAKSIVNFNANGDAVESTDQPTQPVQPAQSTAQPAVGQAIKGALQATQPGKK
jgi:pilus assembly protein CpaB